ncbi:MAG TPA: hypothetical protein VJT49_15605 [Amycolatopsis sp.]|uniref:hypothetical protein n=1 Tax=Amycolatopsis sp. TaxID=37632 RepID=UPI002B4780DD|nr:hypothetical protein [Amycolatopsis sp.]HKS46504.1 hypothetical protein [Amycolatopsis sp.]
MTARHATGLGLTAYVVTDRVAAVHETAHLASPVNLGPTTARRKAPARLSA